MKSSRRFAFVTAAGLMALATPARADYEQAKAGFVFVQAATATIRSDAKGDAKTLATAPHGARLIYRKMLVGDAGSPTWYHVEPPGQPAGWVAAAELADNRPTPLPPGKPLKLVDTGLGNAHPTTSMTAAARGMDERAIKYGKAQDLELTVNQFLTLEKAVEDLYQDPHDDKGEYPETRDNPVRKDHANNFRGSLKK